MIKKTVSRIKLTIVSLILMDVLLKRITYISAIVIKPILCETVLSSIYNLMQHINLNFLGKVIVMKGL